MKTFKLEEREVTIPDIDAVGFDSTLRHIIRDGEFAGVEFTLDNMRVDDEDESLLWYDVSVVAGDATVDKIKEITDNYILWILVQQIEKFKNENPPTE